MSQVRSLCGRRVRCLVRLGTLLRHCPSGALVLSGLARLCAALLLLISVLVLCLLPRAVFGSPRPLRNGATVLGGAGTRGDLVVNLPQRLLQRLPLLGLERVARGRRLGGGDGNREELEERHECRDGVVSQPVQEVARKLALNVCALCAQIRKLPNVSRLETQRNDAHTCGR